MKLRQSLSKHTRVCTALFAVTGAVFHSQIHAQDDSDLDEDVYELSPFIIDSGDQVGYAATTTLSGTRLRTDIKDLGAQIDAMSTEFLEDIAVASADEAFLYSINIESESENPDYGDGNRARFERTGPASTARGIGNSRTTGTTLARNFFETNYQIMSYNTESLSIASGPNAILFGLGQAGGTVNGVLKRAALSDNFGSMGVRFDNNGSKQITFDYNYVILEDKLAVRAAILGSQQESWMEPSFADKKRYYGTLTWKPFEKVTLRIHHEQLDEREAPAQFRMFQDNATPWLRENEGLWNPGDPTHKTMRNGSGRDTLIFNPDGTLAYDIVAWNGTRIGEEMRNYVNERFNAGDTASFAYIPDYNNGLDNRRWTFSPESLAMYNLPWADVNPWGETMQRTRDGEITTAFLEINPFEDFYIELAYNKEEMFGRQFGYNRSFNYNVSVDSSALMPAGEPNPNAGKMFIQDEAWGWETPYNEEEARLTLSYELDFKEKFEEKLGDKIANFLGVHRLAYLYSDRNSDQIRSNSFRLWAQNDDGSTPSILSGGATRVDEPWQTWQRNGGRRVSLRQYLDPANGVNYIPIIPGFEPGAAEWLVPDPANPGSNMRAVMWSEEVGAHRAAFNFDRNIKSNMIAYQGYLWDDRLILTYGRRVDTIKERTLVGANENIRSFARADVESGNIPDYVPAGGNFPWYTTLEWGEYGEEIENTNETKGVVFRPTGLLGGKLDWLTLFYNESSNNAAGTVRFNVDGTRNPPITGEGKDYGFRLDLLEDRLSLRVNWYETASTNNEAGGLDRGIRNDLGTMENNYFERNFASDPAAYTPDGFDPVTGDMSIFLPTSDRVSEGVEYTVLAQPKKGWNIRFTAAKTESTVDNIATDWVNWALNRESTYAGTMWYEEDLDGSIKPVVEWRPDSATGVAPTQDELVAGGFTRIDPSTGSVQVNADGTPTTYRTRLGSAGDTPISGWNNIPHADNGVNPQTMAEWWQQEMIINNIEVIKQFNGQPNPLVRKWRANLTSSYQFQEGRLRGWRFGGSMRYRDKGVIGFARKEISDGTTSVTVPDVSNPFYNDSQFFVDAFVAYRGSTKVFGEDRKFRVQMNIRNLFDNSDLYPTNSTTTGVPTIWAALEPRTFIFSASIDL